MNFMGKNTSSKTCNPLHMGLLKIYYY